MAKRKTGIEAFQHNMLLPFPMINGKWYVTPGNVYTIKLPVVNFDSNTVLEYEELLNIDIIGYTNTSLVIQAQPDPLIADGDYEINLFNSSYSTDNLVPQLGNAKIIVDSSLTQQEAIDLNESHFEYSYYSKTVPDAPTQYQSKYVVNLNNGLRYFYDDDINFWVTAQEFEIDFSRRNQVNNGTRLRYEEIVSELTRGFAVGSQRILFTKFIASRDSSATVLSAGNIQILVKDQLTPGNPVLNASFASGQYISEGDLLLGASKYVTTASSENIVSARWSGQFTNNLSIKVKYRKLWS